MVTRQRQGPAMGPLTGKRSTIVILLLAANLVNAQQSPSCFYGNTEVPKSLYSHLIGWSCFEHVGYNAQNMEMYACLSDDGFKIPCLRNGNTFWDFSSELSRQKLLTVSAEKETLNQCFQEKSPCQLNPTSNKMEKVWIPASVCDTEPRNKFHIAMLSISFIVGVPAFISLIYFTWNNKPDITLLLHRNLICAITFRSLMTLLIQTEIILPKSENSDYNSQGIPALATFETLTLDLVLGFWMVQTMALWKIITNDHGIPLRVNIYTYASIGLSLSFTLIWIIVMASTQDLDGWIGVRSWPQWLNEPLRIIFLIFQVGLITLCSKHIFWDQKNPIEKLEPKTARRVRIEIIYVLLLTPIFILQFALNAGTPTGSACEEAYFYIFYFIDGLQGALVCLFFFYIDSEVKKKTLAVFGLDAKPTQQIRTLDSLREQRTNNSNDVVYSSVLDPERHANVLQVYQKHNLIPMPSVTIVEGEQFVTCLPENLRKVSTATMFYDAVSNADEPVTAVVDSKYSSVGQSISSSSSSSTSSRNGSIHRKITLEQRVSTQAVRSSMPEKLDVSNIRSSLDEYSTPITEYLKEQSGMFAVEKNSDENDSNIRKCSTLNNLATADEFDPHTSVRSSSATFSCGDERRPIEYSRPIQIVLQRSDTNGDENESEVSSNHSNNTSSYSGENSSSSEEHSSSSDTDSTTNSFIVTDVNPIRVEKREKSIEYSNKIAQNNDTEDMSCENNDSIETDNENHSNDVEYSYSIDSNIGENQQNIEKDNKLHDRNNFSETDGENYPNNIENSNTIDSNVGKNVANTENDQYPHDRQHPTKENDKNYSHPIEYSNESNLKNDANDNKCPTGETDTNIVEYANDSKEDGHHSNYSNDDIQTETNLRSLGDALDTIYLDFAAEDAVHSNIRRYSGSISYSSSDDDSDDPPNDGEKLTDDVIDLLMSPSVEYSEDQLDNDDDSDGEPRFSGNMKTLLPSTKSFDYSDSSSSEYSNEDPAPYCTKVEELDVEETPSHHSDEVDSNLKQSNVEYSKPNNSDDEIGDQEPVKDDNHDLIKMDEPFPVEYSGTDNSNLPNVSSEPDISNIADGLKRSKSRSTTSSSSSSSSSSSEEEGTEEVAKPPRIEPELPALLRKRFDLKPAHTLPRSTEPVAQSRPFSLTEQRSQAFSKMFSKHRDKILSAKSEDTAEDWNPQNVHF